MSTAFPCAHASHRIHVRIINSGRAVGMDLIAATTLMFLWRFALVGTVVRIGPTLGSRIVVVVRVHVHVPPALPAPMRSAVAVNAGSAWALGYFPLFLQGVTVIHVRLGQSQTRSLRMLLSHRTRKQAMRFRRYIARYGPQ
ncbi:hypothetical protein PENSPDRAFT_288256 [Peniophora sp. CONT]|nr:hypothetical protein PENSPDRAFT_288256 [Peniophora sp. CONT]